MVLWSIHERMHAAQFCSALFFFFWHFSSQNTQGFAAIKIVFTPFYCAVSGIVQSPIKLVKIGNSIKEIPVPHEGWPVVWLPFCFALSLLMLNKNGTGFNQVTYDVCGVISLFSDLFVQSSYYTYCYSSEYSSHLVFAHPSIHLISSEYSFVFAQWLLLGLAISFGLQSLPVTFFSVSLSVFYIVTTEATLFFSSSVSISFFGKCGIQSLSVKCHN